MSKKRGAFIFGIGLGIIFSLVLYMNLANATITDPVLYYQFNKADFIGADAKVPNSAPTTTYNALKGNVYEGADIIPMFNGAGGIAIFNGSGFISVEDNNYIDIGISDFTISFWTRGSWVANSVLLSKMDSSGKGYEIRATSSNRLVLKIANSISNSWTIGLDVPDTSQWHHIAFSVSRSGQSKVYLDGAQTTSLTGALSQDISNSNALLLGAEQLSSGLRTNFFTGYLDEFMIYTSSLSSTDISILFSTQTNSMRGITLDVHRVYIGYNAGTSGSGTYTVPNNVHFLAVEVVGSGAEGSGDWEGYPAPANWQSCWTTPGTWQTGVGAGGGYAFNFMSTTPGQQYNYIVGKGGPTIINCQDRVWRSSKLNYYWQHDASGNGQTSSFGVISSGGGTGIFNVPATPFLTPELQYYAGGIGLSNFIYSANGQDYTSSVKDTSPETDSCKFVGAKSGYPFSRGGSIGVAPKYGGGGAGSTDPGGYCEGGSGADGLIVITEYLNAEASPSPICEDSQRILRLYSNTDSHGAIYTEQNYPVQICYDKIFGQTYNGAEPHSCTGSNKVMGLSSTTNAHAENPNLDDYPVDICYGDLSCTLRDNLCNLDEKAVVSLSSNDDAHLALGTDAIYTKKICCKTGGASTGMGVEHRQIYFVNTELNFAHTPATGNSVSWLIEGPNGEEITSAQQSFTKSFTSAGQRTITLTEKDANGIIKSESQISILIINNAPGVLAFINKPIHKQYITNADLKVGYDATDSYVINVAGSSCPTITCLAGNCPTATKNFPSGCTSNVLIGGSRSLGYNNVKFSWMFHGPEQDVVGIGSNFASGTQGYSRSGEYLIDLMIRYSYSGLDTQSLLFQREFTISSIGGCKDGICAICEDDGQWLVFLNEDNTENYRVPTGSSLTNPPACAGIDEIAGTDDDCCPAGQICRTAQGGIVGGCFPSDITSCGDYTTQDDCEAGHAWQTDETRLTPDKNGKTCGSEWADGMCIYNIVCDNCRWVDDALEGIKKCQLERTDRPSSDNPEICNPSLGESVCTYTMTDSTECTNGFKTLTIQASLQDGTSNLGNDACESGLITIPCGRSVLELPFFEAWQIIGAIAVIFAVYFLIDRKKLSN